MATSPIPFPNKLKKYRRILGYSQKEVAQMCGFKNSSSISRWEKGDAMPSVKNLLMLSVLYATLPAQLYDELYQQVKIKVTTNKAHK